MALLRQIPKVYFARLLLLFGEQECVICPFLIHHDNKVLHAREYLSRQSSGDDIDKQKIHQFLAESG